MTRVVFSDPKNGTTAPLGDEVLLTASLSPGQAANDAGVEHYKQRRWNLAEQQFCKAVQADEKPAKAHDNLELTLNKLGNHEGAAAVFKKITELSPNNPPLRNSVILKEHVGPVTLLPCCGGVRSCGRLLLLPALPVGRPP